MSAEKKHPFPIIPLRAVWFAISILVVVAGFAKMFLNNQQTGQTLAYGIDFTGGAAYVFKFQKPPAEGDPTRASAMVREALRGVTWNGKPVQDPKIQVFADGEVQVRTKTGSDPDAPVATAAAEAEAEANAILEALRGKFGEVELAGSELVGPVIGKYLRKMALWALFWGCLAITIYIALRYNIKGVGGGWLLGLCAVVALIHDALVMVGGYAWTHTEVNSSFIAAVLTVIGYSVNDTVIIFDRIRENMGKLDTAQRRSFATVEGVIEDSVWQVMTRSVLTVVTTLFPLLTLYLFGGVTIRDFAFALLIGIVSGAYSSIFNASPLFTVLYRRRLAKLQAAAPPAAVRRSPQARRRVERPAEAAPVAEPAQPGGTKRERPQPSEAPGESPPTAERPKTAKKSGGGSGKRKRRH